MLSISSIVLGQGVYKYNHYTKWKNGKFIEGSSISNKKYEVYELEDGSYSIGEHISMGLRTSVEYYRANLIKKEGDVLHLSVKSQHYDNFGRSYDYYSEYKFAKTYMEVTITFKGAGSVKYRYYNK